MVPTRVLTSFLAELPLPDPSSNRGKAEVASFMLMLYGAITMLLCWVVVVVVHVTGVETLEAPPRTKLGLLCLNACLDSLYNGLLLFGILIASPLFMSVGCMLVSDAFGVCACRPLSPSRLVLGTPCVQVMPASIIVDWIANGTELAPLAVVGAVLIIVAFIMLNLTTGSLRLSGRDANSRKAVAE